MFLLNRLNKSLPSSLLRNKGGGYFFIKLYYLLGRGNTSYNILTCSVRMSVAFVRSKVYY